jgi:predicted dehydrogenase
MPIRTWLKGSASALYVAFHALLRNTPDRCRKDEEMESKHILVVGAGSAGKRHAGNLISLGCRISFVDPRADRLTEVQEKMGIQGIYTSLEDAWRMDGRIDGVAITSPPAFHVEQSIAALEKSIPVLLEKPVCPDEAGAQKLAKVQRDSGVPLLLTYTWRWWAPLRRVKELLERRAVGQIRHVKFVMSAHLADWHPWENYWDFFMASKTLGGGALLDESHWIDLMLWFFGKPERVIASIGKISELKIETDDNVDMLVFYKDGMRVTLHLDLYGRPHEKYIRFVGEQGTISWTVDPNRIRIGREMTETWETQDFECERNDMFLDADREFLNVLNGGSVQTCTIEDGLKVLSVIEAARESSASGCAVVL